ncbi:MAG TPA: tetratricopeptide repeat protein [Streptosporangiaceae bacterium]|nr:tetratricopeptide repeat protein [Streptosporangiaceae bacterium]
MTVISGSFSTLLRRYRLAVGLTQEELSASAGLSARTISNLESGHTTRPYQRSVHLLADALQLAGSDRAYFLRAARGVAREAGERQPPEQRGDPRGQLPGPEVLAPAQLPPDIIEFTGRTRQVEWLVACLADGKQSRAVRVATITGVGGMGKSTLAIHVAHLLRTEFPDGQLFVELHGSREQPVSKADALTRLLRHLGVPEAAMPKDEADRIAAYRTKIADRRMLIVLDDARDAVQVRPLLPGTGSSAVLISSRSWLAELEGGRTLALTALDDADALALLSTICEPERVAAEPEAARELLARCGGLPLAVRIAAARLASRPRWSIGALADRLAGEGQRLEELQHGDLAVRASFQVSYAALTGSAAQGGDDYARAFRLLGLWPGSDISLPAAAALLGVDVRSAARRLERLVDMHMLEATSEHSYRFHDLIRAFSVECAQQGEPADSCESAVRRVLSWYMHTADRALTSLELSRRHDFALAPVEPGALPLEFSNYDAAADWSDAERDNVVAAVMLAFRWGLQQICAQLADVVWRAYLRNPWDGWVQVLEVGIASAAAIADSATHAWLLTFLGIALMYRGKHSEALARLEQALPLSRLAGDLRCEATVTGNIAIAFKELKRYDEAIGHLERCGSIDPDPDPLVQGRTMMNLGMLYVEVGRVAEGARQMERALEMVNRSGDHSGDSLARSLLSDAYRQLGRSEDAIRFARSALDISRRVRDQYQEAAAWNALGQALTEVGDTRQAHSCLTRALALTRDLGIPMWSR